MRPENEQLLNIAMVRRLREDPAVRIVRRQCDLGWLHDVPKSTTSLGWLPFRGEICIANGSSLAAWLDDPRLDLRGLNEGDIFLRGLMFAAHDYLHIWAIDQIRRHVPALDFAVAPLGPDRVEEHVLALLITEAVATVGVDYWWLCQRDLSDELDIGTNFKTLTVSYDQRRRDEYRRFAPSLDVDHPSFFGVLTRFYATGRFPGFDPTALRRSPCVLRWLEHELTYGQLQRRYSRLWLQHLSGRSLYERSELDKAVQFDCSWFDPLVEVLGERLWALVKYGEYEPTECLPAPNDTWKAPERGPIDFRFTNLNALQNSKQEVARRGIHPDSKRHWREQVLRTRRFPHDDRPLASALIEIDNEALFRWSVEQLAPNEEATEETAKDMFFLK